MKMSKEHLALLTKNIVPLDTPERREQYLAGDFPRSDAVKDLNKRYRWDLFWTMPNECFYKVTGDPVFGGDYSDAHIDTALRSIVPPLET